MDTKYLKKLSEQMDALAEAFIAIGGTFRAAAGGGASAAVNGKAGSKPAAKSKPAPEPEDEPTDGDEVDLETLREKLKELAETKGKEAMVAALAEVGAAKLAEVDGSQYTDCFNKAVELLGAEEEPEEEPEEKPKAKPAAKKAAAKKGPTLEELQEAAQALIAADKPAFLKLSKKYGKPSEADEAKYAAYLKDIQAAMPAEEEAGDDDLLYRACGPGSPGALPFQLSEKYMFIHIGKIIEHASNWVKQEGHEVGSEIHKAVQAVVDYIGKASELEHAAEVLARAGFKVVKATPEAPDADPNLQVGGLPPRDEAHAKLQEAVQQPGEEVAPAVAEPLHKLDTVAPAKLADGEVQGVD